MQALQLRLALVYLSRSTVRMAKYQEVYRDWYGRQNDIPLPDRHKIHVPAIVLDCPTRWNSLYYMIRRGIVLCPIFSTSSSLCLNSRPFDCPQPPNGRSSRVCACSFVGWKSVRLFLFLCAALSLSHLNALYHSFNMAASDNFSIQRHPTIYHLALWWYELRIDMEAFLIENEGSGSCVVNAVTGMRDRLLRFVKEVGDSEDYAGLDGDGGITDDIDDGDDPNNSSLKFLPSFKSMATLSLFDPNIRLDGWVDKWQRHGLPGATILTQKLALHRQYDCCLRLTDSPLFHGLTLFSTGSGTLSLSSHTARPLTRSAPTLHRSRLSI